ncbi:SGNH/GDSL hydrolase family protein [Aquirufa rosea]|uniref:SGNH/GDSL hydrolase family protein n=1 Tax=Aquirufa rosea TaxID=2509241 RepID=A0A4Q1BX56_9BACT|nr:SGNH/GDSL hydrolase family protein [Aquirufa rosea]RXK46558.1 SGNH/GDSL hydrolase family protein [Aquirufa rosea]
MKKFLFLFAFVLLHSSFVSKEKTWVAIGDSITYLNEHPDETGNRISKGYMTRVVEDLPQFRYINKGFNGWTAVKIATDWDKLNIPVADIYTVFLGTNDWWGSKSLGTFSDYQGNTGPGTVNGAFRVILDHLKKLNPQAKLVLITPMQRVDFVYINNFKNNAYGSYKEKNGQKLEQFADAIKAIAQFENIPCVDLYHKKGMDHAQLVRFKYLKDPNSGKYKKFSYPDFVDVPFNPAIDEYPYPVKASKLTYDGLHPSDKGYVLIADELKKIFKSW